MLSRDGLLALCGRIAEAHAGTAVKGKKLPCTAVNGNMFSFLSSEGELRGRFDAAMRAEFARAHGMGAVMQYGAVLRGYVAMPVDGTENQDWLAEIFAESLAHARGVPPGPAKKSLTAAPRRPLPMPRCLRY